MATMPASMIKKPTDIDVAREIALALPGVAEGTMHGNPSWKVKGKLLACPAIHCSVEPNTLAVRVEARRREGLIEAAPQIYYVTDHYLTHPMVLVRLGRIDRDALRDLLGMAWSGINAAKKTQGRAGRMQSRKTAE